MSNGPRRWWVPSTTITDAGRRTRLNLQSAVVALLIVSVVGWALTEFGRAQVGTGPNGSSFVTDVNGTAALAELLTEMGHDVNPSVTPLTDLRQVGTLLILDPGFRSEFGDEELRSISEWVEGGGRLIASGRPHPDLVGTLLPGDLRHGFSGQSSARVVTPIRGVDGEIATDGVYSIETDADLVPLAGEPPIAGAFQLGEGVIVYVADGSILWNPQLDENGPWIVSLISPEGPVLFDEVRHGFAIEPGAQTPTGLLAAMPDGVRNVVLLLVPVLLIALIVYGRRFGPPEEAERHLAPPRRELVDAVAGIMTRIPDTTEAAGPIPLRLREVVARRAGLAESASNEDLLEAAAELGIDAERLQSSLNPTDHETMLEAQQMLARLSGRENQ